MFRALMLNWKRFSHRLNNDYFTMPLSNHHNPTSSPALSVAGICKNFGDVTANDHIDLDIHANQIHALLGENGAGKSTLVSILYGLFQPDAGSIFLDGNEIRFHHPHEALQNGIALVQQHFSLLPELSVLENIILGQEPVSFWGIDFVQAREQCKNIIEQYHLDLPLEEKVSSLPLGIQQRVEIAKVLFRKARILFFDEPTAALVTHEIQTLIKTLKFLRDQDIAVVFITHRLEEVIRCADQVTVLRHGKVVCRKTQEEMQVGELAKAIVGEETPKEKYNLPEIGKPVLSLHQVSSAAFVPLQNLCFDVHEHEIFGIAGISGNGQDEIINIVMGQEEIHAGTIKLHGEDIQHFSTKQRREKGLALIPQDRQKNALIPEFSVLENAMLNRSGLEEESRLFQNPNRIKQTVEKQIRKFEVKANSVWQPVSTLSGGHQQRLVISRELASHPKVIIAYDPARGLDIRASWFVHESLINACANRSSVLLFSSEISELFLLCRRIAVLHQGRITGIRTAEDWTAVELGKAMTGANSA